MTIHYDIPMAKYHDSPMLGSSKLKDFASRGARYFAARHITRTSPDEPDSDALIFGTVFEDIVQGRGFNADGNLVIKPEGMIFNTKENKKWRDDHLAAGRSIVSPADIDRAMAMREALEDNETACELIRSCKKQVTLRAAYAGTPGLQSRPDWLSLDGCLASGYAPFSLDLKSTKTLSDIAGGKGVLKYRYDAQAAICRELLSVSGSRHFLLACEKALPFRCQVVEVSPDWLDCGWRWTERQLTRLAAHYASDSWPRVDRELIALPPPPPWADNDNESADDDEEAA